MKKSCSYCGRIHDVNFQCPKKPKAKYRSETRDHADRFRSTAEWQRKRDEIKERDKFICQVCIRGMYHTFKTISYKGIEVHHIEKLRKHPEKGLENYNLISLCKYHHDMADTGEIPARVLKVIAAEQEQIANGHPPEVRRPSKPEVPTSDRAPQHTQTSQNEILEKR